jgi:hypothetical protein
MFTSPQPNIFESSDGFSVEVLGRTGLCYREGDRKMFVDSEVLMGPSGMAVYRTSIARWDAPHHNESIEKVDRERILENIRDAFRFQGFEIDVI